MCLKMNRDTKVVITFSQYIYVHTSNNMFVRANVPLSLGIIYYIKIRHRLIIYCSCIYNGFEMNIISIGIIVFVTWFSFYSLIRSDDLATFKFQIT